jgi:hypothetical protein
MSSAVLYLAIVAVWGVVLVPMWLRRDGDGLTRLLHRRGDTGELPEIEEEPEEEQAPEQVPPVRRNARAAVIARRRRRTLGLGLLVLASAGAVLGGLAPWWFALPSSALFAAHVWLLRVAARLDAVRQRERRIADLRAAEADRRARREEELAREAERSAEVIELPGRHREEVYDQYTDLRAVGH